MRIAGSMKRSSVRPFFVYVCLSVRLSRGSTTRAECNGFAAERPAGKRSIDSRRRRSAATALQHGAQIQWRRQALRDRQVIAGVRQVSLVSGHLVYAMGDHSRFSR